MNGYTSHVIVDIALHAVVLMMVNHLFFMLHFEALEPAGVSYIAQDSSTRLNF